MKKITYIVAVLLTIALIAACLKDDVSERNSLENSIENQEKDLQFEKARPIPVRKYCTFEITSINCNGYDCDSCSYSIGDIVCRRCSGETQCNPLIIVSGGYHAGDPYCKYNLSMNSECINKPDNCVHTYSAN